MLKVFGKLYELSPTPGWSKPGNFYSNSLKKLNQWSLLLQPSVFNFILDQWE